jgi:hypothetical protein
MAGFRYNRENMREPHLDQPDSRWIGRARPAADPRRCKHWQPHRGRSAVSVWREWRDRHDRANGDRPEAVSAASGQRPRVFIPGPCLLHTSLDAPETQPPIRDESL